MLRFFFQRPTQSDGNIHVLCTWLAPRLMRVRPDNIQFTVWMGGAVLTNAKNFHDRHMSYFLRLAALLYRRALARRLRLRAHMDACSSTANTWRSLASLVSVSDKGRRSASFWSRPRRLNRRRKAVRNANLPRQFLPCHTTAEDTKHGRDEATFVPVFVLR